MGVLSEYRHGALSVVATAETPDWIDRQLKAIDWRLMVEKQLDFTDREVWCVVEDTGEQRGQDRYVTVYEFRGPDGEPIPYLHQAIVDEMQRRAKDGSGNIQQAAAIAARRNRDRLERKRAETDEAYIEIGKDFDSHRKIGHFAVVPRSRGLQITRARVRTETDDARRAARQALAVYTALRRMR